jgi:phenylacetate-CoA ligase
MPAARHSPGYAWAVAHRLPGREPAAAWSFQERLEESQWHSGRQHLAFQLKNISTLLQHAVANVPWFRDMPEAKAAASASELDLKIFRRIPIQTRRHLQEHKAALTAERVPPHHGASMVAKSSGSTGAPVETLVTELAGAWNRALLLRGHLWAYSSFEGRMAVIRRYKKGVADYPDGFTRPSWSDETTLPFETGSAFGLNAGSSVAEQVAWLNNVLPAALFTYPTQLAALVDAVDRGELRLPDLRRIMTISETLDDEVREQARRVLGVEIFDVYSANETGAIALQCPDAAGYHVQSEGMLVEVLDDRGEPCGPGANGRVVLTLLHSYAFPLIRYDIGDFATVGRTCRCGRHLPLLDRIIGRQRNMMIGPKGERFRPSLGWRRIRGLAPISQGQFVQHTVGRLEAVLVVERPLTAEEEETVRTHLRSRMPQLTEIVFNYVSKIPRSESGKYEDFVSLMKPPSDRP